MTEKLYQKDVNMTRTSAVVTETDVDRDGSILIALDRTVFFPEGGGQPCDTGTIGGFTVTDVRERNGVIWHKLAGECGLRAGSTAEALIDWERRFCNMQRHCGEHILSGAFFKLYGAVNRGFHMGDEYMTVDMSLEGDTSYSEITWDMAIAAERLANETIWKDLPVTARHYATKEDASGRRLRKELTIEQDITIVTVGGQDEPADACACCGTHPTSSGQVGLIKIYKIELNKGMYRIFFEAGSRALEGYDSRYDVLTYLEKDMSAGFSDIIAKYNSRKDKAKSVRDRLYKLTQETLSREKSELGAALASGTAVRHYSLLTLDDLIGLGRSLEGSIPGILYLVDDTSNTVLLFSDTTDCGRMVKENANVFAGRGGGGDTFARAIFSRKDDLEMFIDAAEKLRR